MPQIDSILDNQIAFDPAADLDAFLRQVPAKWAVYLFSDANDQPVQLLCVKNLRYSLKRRLHGEEISLTKRIDYREIVRKISWRRVDSAFEADWIYHDVARQIFPETYKGMVGFRPAWFIHVDPESKFPRYTKTINLQDKPGLYFGPVEDKHAAARLIELLEDAFDLCRYYNVLVEAPKGRACAYKEMGKCPAPCDGSVSMDQYHRLIEWSAQTLFDPREMIREHTERMNAAAAELRFETASRIKSFIDQLKEFNKGAFRHAHPLHDFSFITLQPGPKTGQVKLFLIIRGQITELAALTAEPLQSSELLRTIYSTAETDADVPLDPTGIERIGIAANHLFSPRQSQGAFIPLCDLADPSRKALQKAYKTAARAKPQEESQVEGILRELQAM